MKQDVVIEPPTVMSDGTESSTLMQEVDDYERSFLARKVRSIFSWVGGLVVLCVLPTAIISIVWLIFYLIQAIQRVEDIRENTFQSMVSNVDSTFNGPKVLAKTLATNLKFNLINNETRFNQMGNQIMYTLDMNKELFKAGLQLGFMNNNTLVGLKRSPDVDTNEMLMFVQWDKNYSRNELPDPNQPWHSLGYYKVVNGMPQSTPWKVVENFPIKGMAGYIELTKKSFNKGRDYKEAFAQPKLYSCATQDLVCSYISEYSVAFTEDPLIGGMYTSFVQVTRVPQMLREITPQGHLAFIINVQNNAILGSNDETIKNYYTWDGEKHVPMDAAAFEITSIQYCVNMLQNQFGQDYKEVSQSETSSVRMTDPSGVVYFVDTQKYTSLELELLMVHMTPEWTHFKMTVIIGLVLGLITIGMTVITLCGGCFAAFTIYRPLTDFVDHVDGITDGLDLESIEFQRRPFFTEFDTLYITFRYLIEKLKLYRTFLPEHILKQVDEPIVDNKQSKKNKEMPQETNGNLEIDSDKVSSENSSIKDMNSSFYTLHSSHDSMASMEDTGMLAMNKVNATFLVMKLKYPMTSQVGLNMTTLSKILNFIVNTSKELGGHVESFTDEEIVVGFNSISTNTKHDLAASELAIKIVRNVNYLSIRGSTTIFRYGIGIGTGKMYIGTIGTLTKRTWQAIGLPLIVARTLSTHALDINVPILVSQQLIHMLPPNTFYDRFADNLYFEDRSKLIAYQLIGFQLETSNEWIYEVEQQKNASSASSSNHQQHPYQDYDEAITNLFSNNLEDAYRLMESFLATHSTDVLAKQFLHLIKHLMESNIPWKDYILLTLQSFEHLKGCGQSYLCIVNHRSFSS